MSSRTAGSSSARAVRTTTSSGIGGDGLAQPRDAVFDQLRESARAHPVPLSQCRQQPSTQPYVSHEVEQRVRVETHPHLDSKHWGLSILKFSAVIPPTLIFILEFMQSPVWRGKSLDDFGTYCELVAAIWAFTVSCIAHFVIDAKEAFVRRATN